MITSEHQNSMPVSKEISWSVFQKGCPASNSIWPFFKGLCHGVSMISSPLIIFDCDGVLVDSEFIACKIEAEELTRIGYVLSPEECIRRFSGKSQKTIMETVEGELGQPLPCGFAEQLENRILDALSKELEPIEGVEEILSRIPRKCIASSGSPEKIQNSLKATGLVDHFLPQNIYSATMVQNGKPAPDLFLLASERMGRRPSQCIVVEDSIHGIQAAKAAGMYVVGFTGGSHIMNSNYHASLKRAGADEVCAHMTEFSAHLAEFNVFN